MYFPWGSSEPQGLLSSTAVCVWTMSEVPGCGQRPVESLFPKSTRVPFKILQPLNICISSSQTEVKSFQN